MKSSKNISRVICLFIMLFMSVSQAQDNVQTAGRYTPEAKAKHDARMEWWHEAKFGMFIHWGLYAIPARGEWVMSREKIPVTEYAKLAEQFNPVKFNAEQWVRFAKDAGMKYIVITSKHHDGFAMFGSKVTPYNIVDATPFKRDPIRELADACAKEGIKLGFYYSQSQDWHHPGGAANKGSWDPLQSGDFDQYLRTIAFPQVRELLEGYSPAVIWFDTPRNITPAYAREFVQLVRSIKPETLVNSRLMYSGRVMQKQSQAKMDEMREIGMDYLSYPDRTIPANPNPSWGEDWETCMTLNGAWGFNKKDRNWKSPQTVVQMLVRVVNKGGNFLLNFGPTAEGEIPAESMEIMKPVGEWLRVNGEAIYGAGPCDLVVMSKPDGSAGEATKKSANDWLATSRRTQDDAASKNYLHIFKWPSGALDVKGITGKISKAYLLSDKQTLLRFSQMEGMLTVELPKNSPDPIASVVCLEFEEESS